MPEQYWLNASPDIRLSVETFGDHSCDRAILLISGAGAPAAFWPNPFCVSLSQSGFLVIRFDQRDTGASTHLENSYPIGALIEDVESVIKRFGPETVHLVGHSLGGYIALSLLIEADHTQIASGVVISAGPTTDPSQYDELGMSQVSEETWRKLEQAPRTGNYSDDLPNWLSTWRFLNGARDFDTSLATHYTQALHEGDVRNRQVATNHIHAATTLPSNLPKRLSEISVPLLVIHGTDDLLVPPDNAEALVQLTPNAKYCPLEGAGHIFFSFQTWSEIEAIILEEIAAD